MSYILERFDDTSLPTHYDFNIDVGTGPSQDASFVLPGGGVYDPRGSDEAPRDKTFISLSGAYIENDGATLTTTYRALRARRGDYGKLYRRWLVSGGTAVEWCYARLLAVTGNKDQSEPFRQLVTCSFVMLSPMWYGHPHGLGWTLDSGVQLDTGYVLDDTADTVTLTGSPQAFTFYNNGNGRVENAIVTIHAGSSALTSFTVEIVGRVRWTYAASIAAGQNLVVDTGAWSVKNNGVDAYTSAFTLHATQHLENSLLPLLPGENVIQFTWTGGGTGSTVTIAYHDGWE